MYHSENYCQMKKIRKFFVFYSCFVSKCADIIAVWKSFKKKRILICKRDEIYITTFIRKF